LLGLAMMAPGPLPGDTIEPLKLVGPNGGPCSWQPGRVTVLSIVAFWCDTWKQHVPQTLEAERALRDSPADVMIVSLDGQRLEMAPKSLAKRLYVDRGGAWSSPLGIRCVPFTLVIDARGCVRWAASGIQRAGDIAAAARDALGPARTGPVHLTFDDFPSGGPADLELLDALRAEGVQATFFCIGRKAEANPATIARALRDGHSLQVHGYDHDPAKADPDKAAAALIRLGAERPELVRLPGTERVRGPDGFLSNRTVNPYDYTRPGEEEVLRRVLSAARPNSAILLHAGVSDTVRALPEMIKRLRRLGLEPGPLTTSD
jgi:peptidoglycan/xylan/chitin deacetylase (PgdA/CDA1 family)